LQKFLGVKSYKEKAKDGPIIWLTMFMNGLSYKRESYRKIPDDGKENEVYASKPSRMMS
jgi:hypothetical protein